jgi:hypothetical protein
MNCHKEKQGNVKFRRRDEIQKHHKEKNNNIKKMVTEGMEVKH